MARAEYSASVVWENPPRAGRSRVAFFEITRRSRGRVYTAEVRRVGLLSMAEASAILKVNPATLWRWTRQEPPRLKLVTRRGHYPLLSASEVARLIEAREEVKRSGKQQGRSRRRTG